MVFDRIFDAALNLSKNGAEVEKGLNSFIPWDEAELKVEPPHDPSLPILKKTQDPKIVRETSPQAKATFDFANNIASLIGSATKANAPVFNDPASTVTTAFSTMQEADEKTKSYPDNKPEPEKKENLSVDLPNPPHPENESVKK